MGGFPDLGRLAWGDKGRIILRVTVSPCPFLPNPRYPVPST
ncbi:hypothetical protein [Chlorogloeopsis sp. ULAP02]